MTAEEIAGTASEGDALMAVRADAYSHLREVAAQGWSFCDMLSFRERIARYRATES